MNKYIGYLNNLGEYKNVENWINTTLKNYLEKNNPSQDEVEHIIDYLISDKAPSKIERMSYKQALSNTNKWNATLIKKGCNITENKSDTEVHLDFNDGFKIVKLLGKNAFEREGYLMRHCVASYYGKGTNIYSLRDKENMPHCTIEENQQIKGKGNGDIHPKYIDYVVKFLESINMTVGDNEMKHLGYINVSKIKKELHKDTNYFNKVYLPKDEKLIGIDGKEFASLDLLDTKDLIVEHKDSLKINFELSSFIKLSIKYLFSKNKKIFSGDWSKLASSGNRSKLASSGDGSKLASSGDWSKLASSGDWSKLASSGNRSKLASSGDESQLASSGDGSKLASSGDWSQLASSGDGSKLASSGDGSKLASSGDWSKLASSGDWSKLASSGDESQLASSGDGSKLASSGDWSKLASSGDESKLASSGDESQLASSGKDSVCANIGINGSVKGIIGNWITLAEYNNYYKPICVKSIKVDGKKIKENVYYQLKNGKFTEIN